MGLLDYIYNEGKGGNEEQQNEKSVEDEKKLLQLKPPSMPEEDFKAALSVFSPERISELYNGFDPQSTKPFYEQLYKVVKTSPVEPDEKRLQASRNLASLGDALSLIIQSIAATQGSFIEKRDPRLSASHQADLNIQRLKDVYKKDKEVYDTGLIGAQMKDIEGNQSLYQHNRAALLNLLAKMREANFRNKRFIGEMNYRYDKLKNDEKEQKLRIRQLAASNQLKREKLDWDKARHQLIQKDTPKGYIDFYNSQTGMTYRVAEKKWKANYTQIFNQIKNDLFKIYPLLKSAEKLGSLKPSEKEEYVKQFMYDNPDAIGFLESIADKKFQDGTPIPKPEIPQLTEIQFRAISALAQKYQKDEIKALSEIANFLKSQGFKQEDVKALLKAIQE